MSELMVESFVSVRSVRDGWTANMFCVLAARAAPAISEILLNNKTSDKQLEKETDCGASITHKFIKKKIFIALINAITPYENKKEEKKTRLKRVTAWHRLLLDYVSVWKCLKKKKKEIKAAPIISGRS